MHRRKYTAGQATKTAILNQAFHLFAQQGYQMTTIEAIMKPLSKAKGVFYVHFKNKEELFIEIMNDRMYLQHQTIEQALETIEHTSATALIESIIEQLVVQAHQENWIALYFEFVSHVNRNVLIQKQMSQMYQEWHSFLVSILTSFQANNLLANNFDPSTVATMIIGLYDGLNLFAHVNGLDTTEQINMMKLFISKLQS